MRLQKAPSGILELFALKNEGRNPGEFGETVMPVVEIAEFYGPLLPVAGASNTTLGTAIDTVAVPRTVAGWRLFSVGCSIVVPATTTFPDGHQMTLLLNTSPGASTITLGASPVTPPVAAYAAAGSLFWAITFPKPLVLPPGAVLSARFQRSAVLAPTVQVNGSVQELPLIQ